MDDLPGLNVIDPELLLDIFDEPIVIHRAFLRLTDAVAPALMLSALVQMTQEQVEDQDPSESALGWHCLTQSEWTERIALSRYEQETARRALDRLGLIEQKRVGMPARLHIGLNSRALAEALRAQARERYSSLSSPTLATQAAS